MAKRGKVLKMARKVINGERQDSYGNPEDSFESIAEFWNTYLDMKALDPEYMGITAKDVALMMALFKVAREANQGKQDNLVDAAGYIGIAGDMDQIEDEYIQGFTHFSKDALEAALAETVFTSFEPGDTL